MNYWAKMKVELGNETNSFSKLFKSKIISPSYTPDESIILDTLRDQQNTLLDNSILVIDKYFNNNKQSAAITPIVSLECDLCLEEDNRMNNYLINNESQAIIFLILCYFIGKGCINV